MPLHVQSIPQALLILSEMSLELSERGMQFFDDGNGATHFILRIEGWAITIDLKADAAGSVQLRAAIDENLRTLQAAIPEYRRAFSALNTRHVELRQQIDTELKQANQGRGLASLPLTAEQQQRIDARFEQELAPYQERLEAASRKVWPGAHAQSDGSWHGYLKSLADRGWAQLGAEIPRKELAPSP